MRIALIGTRGVPARYGGFETAIEEVGRRLVDRGHDVTVYCRGDDEHGGAYLGMRLVHLPAMRRRSLETLSHTALSVLHLVTRRRPDTAVVFNAANAPFLPLLRARRVPLATHVDGLEWQRGKWGPAGRRYYRTAESLAVRWSDALIADAQGIADYYDGEFGAETALISYGAPSVDPDRLDRLAELDLAPQGYHLVVARFEPENHVHVAVEGYVRSGATLPLVVVGSAPYADAYTEQVRALADDRVRLLGGVWDQEPARPGCTPGRSPTCTGTRSGARTRPCCGRSVPRPPSTPTTWCSTARCWARRAVSGALPTTSPRWSRPPRPTRRAPASAVAPRGCGPLYDWDDVALAYEQPVPAAGHPRPPPPSAVRATVGLPAGRRHGWERTMTQVTTRQPPRAGSARPGSGCCRPRRPPRARPPTPAS
ncbi:hypothetical protein GCM10025868_14850 [Angustibacter aerolatus]|uniref:Glycosyltransferase subfamily 4-like N-terminal domain-containing protein n=1 Tax=Angustibacter aerolatus TaxID=1162965 RepID=A0ABQ6JDH0_9ACTN|nr:DUF1972 domain-containing protein [Angustibacter aerolatus]GMA86235.1 hypothetical protein GCM10025868_14850 [Angustibacter aerolatus]